MQFKILRNEITVIKLEYKKSFFYWQKDCGTNHVMYFYIRH